MPWLGHDGRYGLATADGKVVVAPRFADAQPGIGGIAPVADDADHWGLVDARGDTILPRDYARVVLVATGHTPIAIAKQEYNAWWRFWDWQVLPEFNILSTASHGPWLVTEVPRAKWTVFDLGSGNTLLQRDLSDAPSYDSYWQDSWRPSRQIPNELEYDSWPADARLRLGHTLYAATAAGDIQAIADDVIWRTRNGDFVQQRRDATYRRLDIDGHPKDDHRYTARSAVTLTTSQGATAVIHNPQLFEDDQGRFFVAPDLSKPLPTRLADYRFDDGRVLRAQDLAGPASAILASVPNSPWFLMISRLYPSDEADPVAYAFFIDSEGRWAPDWHARPGFTRMLSNGDMLFAWTEPYGVVQPDLSFTALPMSRMAQYALGPDRYAGRDAKGRHGIYDSADGRWVFRAADTEVATTPLRWAQTAVYTRNHRRGLIDVQTGQAITEAIYDWIDDDGRATMSNNGCRHEFYLDPETGRAYRDAELAACTE
ncbi:WG repeat-containing protein [Salinisphaera sp. SPP-AMP-43]|uniref:WG repeat-containing protein n=1 Tax=Salinisphaera sp. SPP-AMP-43 TaxID=3121288 RepID=UPI003C6DC9E2